MHDRRFYANADIMNILQIPDDYVKESIAIQMKEIQRRLWLFRQSQEYTLSDKTIILVDDGIATGASIFVAIQWIKNKIPNLL